MFVPKSDIPQENSLLLFGDQSFFWKKRKLIDFTGRNAYFQKLPVFSKE
jgi:hypothetical protein